MARSQDPGEVPNLVHYELARAEVCREDGRQLLANDDSGVIRVQPEILELGVEREGRRGRGRAAGTRRGRIARHSRLVGPAVAAGGSSRRAVPRCRGVEASGPSTE